MESETLLQDGVDWWRTFLYSLRNWVDYLWV